MQKKHKIATLFTLTSFLVLNSVTHPTFAVSPAVSPTPSPKASTSPSSSPSPSPTSEKQVTENLKKRLQETLGESSQSKELSYKSFVGVIRDVIKDTLIIEDKDGKKKIVIKDGASIVRSPGNKTIPADSVRIEDNIISIGSLKESDELEAVRIIVSADPLTTTSKVSALARIAKISKSAITTTSIDSESTKTINLTTKTALKSSLGESLEVADLNVGDSIIYTATLAKDTLTATSLMRIGFADPDASTSPLPSPKE
ncbi:MAG: hypothetical protein DPW11_01980 [bacterium]|nr:hypothetical protein [Candidatus Microgenomates bacterium CPR3]MCQ3944526.1 hypothetical protein [bacterium]RIK51074.1 MAG: hypothetical protein DCC61_03765 [Candidatus Microgenomates bacterium]